jgi:cell fate regulator YaaT (PSP1 superfamily)
MPEGASERLDITMAITIGVRFRQGGKVYDFDPQGLTLLPGDMVVVETARGTECGEVVRANGHTADGDKKLKPVLRRATEEDRRRAEENAHREREAMQIGQERVAAHGLDMKLVDAEYAFDNSKITFNFTAEGRVDFRNLVKDLAGVFHTRIELHQIGVRDEAKKLGGVGICGQPFCCSRFLKDFQPVSIKMAKEQGLSLNPTKISGSCGRLMCCLKYEQDVYEELLKLTPKVGALVMTPEGRGVVTDSAVLAGRLKVRLDKAPDSPPAEMAREDVTVIIRDNNRPAKPKEEPQAAAETEPTETPEQAAPKTERRERRRHRGRGGKGGHADRQKGPQAEGKASAGERN